MCISRLNVGPRLRPGSGAQRAERDPQSTGVASRRRHCRWPVARLVAEVMCMSAQAERTAATSEAVNEVRLVGRISAAPVERTLPSGDTVWTFRIVVPRAAKYVANYLGTDGIAPQRSKAVRAR